MNDRVNFNKGIMDTKNTTKENVKKVPQLILSIY